MDQPPRADHAQSSGTDETSAIHERTITTLRQQLDHLHDELKQARGEVLALEGERDGLLAAMRHLSSPVLPVSSGVVVMPLIGDAQAQRAQAEALVLRQTQAQTQAIDAALRKIAQDAEELAQCAGELYEQSSQLAGGLLWNSRTSMFRSTEGQFVNNGEEPLSVFVPNWVEVDDALLDELNVVNTLLPLLKAKFDRSPHAVANYIFAEHCRFMQTYPNSDPQPDHPGGYLADEFPPDIGITGDPVFWTIADATVNPERTTHWTRAYMDNASYGLMISAIAPIYVGTEPNPRSMIGIDVGLEKIGAMVTAAGLGQQRAAVLADQEGCLVVATEQAYQLLGLPRPQEVARGADLNIDLAKAAHLPGPVLQAMRQGGTGVAPVRVANADYLFAWAPVPTVSWSLGVISPIAQLSGNATPFAETFLSGMQRHRAEVGVLDATGLLSVNEQTVQQIVDVVQMARLLGAEVVVVGITPAVAQMLVEIGADLSHMRSFPDLQTALRTTRRNER